MITTGTLTSSTEPHQKCSSRKPPVTGPIARPSAETPAHTPMARPRSRGSRNTLVMMDRVAGMMNAAPMPMTQRKAMSCPDEPALAASSEPAPNTARPPARAR